jgi:branched-chain amino acid transport system substrate-binding protein
LTFILLSLTTNLGFARPAPIRIALMGPFSGIYASYGTQLLSGATQAADDINKLGGIKGVHLEIMPIDDECNPEVAVQQAEQLVKEKQYQAVIGHACSACALATLNIYAKAKILVITPSATNHQITQRNIATIFRMTGTDTQQSLVAAQFIVKKLHSARVAILHDQDLYSKGLADSVSEDLLYLNKTPILYQSIPRGTHNFTALIKKLRNLKADAIYFAGLYPEVSSLAQSLNVLQLQIPLVTGDAAAMSQFIDAAGGTKAATSVLLTFGTDASSLVSAKTVIHKMHEKHLDTMGYALYAYATVQVMAKAIDSTNSSDGTKLANWLHQHEVDTVLGKKSWDTNGDIIDAGFKVYTWDNERNMEIVAQ